MVRIEFQASKYNFQELKYYALEFKKQMTQLFNSGFTNDLALCVISIGNETNVFDILTNPVFALNPYHLQNTNSHDIIYNFTRKK